LKLLDVNILLYAYDVSSVHHERSRVWLAESLSGSEVVGLPWQTISAFLRITTHPRMVRTPVTMVLAAAVVDSWLERSCVRIVEPGERYWQIFRDLLVDEDARGPLVPDAALAALAIENGATLCSADRDFRRFPGLKLSNPTLAAQI
jgi:uncharacterized protein